MRTETLPFITRSIGCQCRSGVAPSEEIKGTTAQLLAKGILVWRKRLSAEQKRDICDKFRSWKNARNVAALANPLDKFCNAMLYCGRMWACDEAFREKYSHGWRVDDASDNSSDSMLEDARDS